MVAFKVHLTIVTRMNPYATRLMRLLIHPCSCCKTDDLHQKRHKQIFLLVREVQKIDSACAKSETLTRKAKKKKSETVSSTLPKEGEEGSESNGSATLVNDDDREENKCLERVMLGVADVIETKSFQLDDTPGVVTEADLEHVHSVLHPKSIEAPRKRASDDPALTENATVHANISFNANCQMRKFIRAEARARRTSKAKSGENTANDNDRDIPVNAMLALLGIKHQPLQNSKGKELSWKPPCAGLGFDSSPFADLIIYQGARLS